MAMQYDVSSKFVNLSGSVNSDRNRIKGLFFSPTIATNPNPSFVDTSTAITGGTYSQTTTTITVTKANHGLVVGQRVALEFTSGSAASGAFAVATSVDTSTFTVTTPLTGTNSGNVTIYTNVLIELAVSALTQNGFTIPGEGVLCANGIYYVGIVETTVFYG
jgi:hypothetical protein